MPTMPPIDREDRQDPENAGHAPRRFVRLVRVGVMTVRLVGVHVALIEMQRSRNEIVAGMLRLRLRMPVDMRGRGSRRRRS